MSSWAGHLYQSSSAANWLLCPSTMSHTPAAIEISCPGKEDNHHILQPPRPNGPHVLSSERELSKGPPTASRVDSSCFHSNAWAWCGAELFIGTVTSGVRS